MWNDGQFVSLTPWLQISVHWLQCWCMIGSSLWWWWWAVMVEYVRNVKGLVLGKRLDRGGNSWTEGKDGGSTAERVWWGRWETAGCPPENKQTSDYDINANLNVSQWGAWLWQSGAWDEQKHSAAYSSLSLTSCPQTAKIANLESCGIWHTQPPSPTAHLAPSAHTSYPSFLVAMVSLAWPQTPTVVKTSQSAK